GDITIQGGSLSLPDGSQVLFGSTSMLLLRAFVPTVMEYAPNGSIASTYRFWRPWSEGWFVDGIPTGTPGELVGLRWAVDEGGIFVDFLHR
ncbi:TPA: hypothetical protein ACIC77_005013, partial [Escherichia coli]